jgi:hypothetical protein
MSIQSKGQSGSPEEGMTHNNSSNDYPHNLGNSTTGISLEYRPDGRPDSHFCISDSVRHISARCC